MDLDSPPVPTQLVVGATLWLLALYALLLAYFIGVIVVGVYWFFAMCIRMRRALGSERLALFWIGSRICGPYLAGSFYTFPKTPRREIAAPCLYCTDNVLTRLNMQALLRERARFDRVIGGNGARRGLTPAEQMWTLLERYRRRSDRYGQGFWVAVFRSDGSRRAVLRMARSIAGRARLSDEVGWLEGCSVCVILPDTQAAGANCFASAVVELVGPRCGRPQFTL